MSDERDETRPDDASPRPDHNDDPTRVTPQPDSTSVMPPAAADDWAPSRANPVWSGRAEVRSPQPGRSAYDTTDWPVGPAPAQRDRWWMPIVVGIIVLVLLGLLGWGIYVIVQNSGDESPAPAPPPTAATTATTTESTEPTTTTPTTSPTATTPSTSPTTTEPTTTEVTVPALRGLSQEEAEAALARTGLKSRVIYRNGNAPPGTVIDSDPAEGQEVPPDTRVTLVVAKGATTTPTTATTGGPAAGD